MNTPNKNNTRKNTLILPDGLQSQINKSKLYNPNSKLPENKIYDLKLKKLKILFSNMGNKYEEDTFIEKNKEQINNILHNISNNNISNNNKSNNNISKNNHVLDIPLYEWLDDKTFKSVFKCKIPQ